MKEFSLGLWSMEEDRMERPGVSCILSPTFSLLINILQGKLPIHHVNWTSKNPVHNMEIQLEPLIVHS